MSFTLSNHVDSSKVFIERKGKVSIRWDPHYHSPRFSRLDAQLDTIGAVPIRKRSEMIFSGITPLSGGDAYTDQPDGVAFIRSGDFNEDGTINEDSLIQLKPENHHKLMRRSQLRKEDVLFAIVGATIGKVGIFHGEYEANINQAVCAVRAGGNLSPRFLHAFFLTRLGKQQIDRVKRPVARANINLEEIGTLRIPVLPEGVQTRVSEALERAFKQKVATEIRASQLLASIDDLLLSELGIPNAPESPNTLESRMFQRSISEVSGNRIDPIANQEKRKRLEDSIHAANCPVVPLRKLVQPSKDLVKEIDGGDIYIGLENISGDTGDFIPTNDKDSVSAAIRFQRGEILFPKLRPYLNKTHLAEFGGLCSTEFHVFHANGVSSEYLTHFLRSRAIVEITSLLMTGNTLPRLQTEDILKLPIPQPSLALQERICFEIGSIRSQVRSLRSQAKADLEQAKREIEVMILGEPTEAV